jgi:hypothetical protein
VIIEKLSLTERIKKLEKLENKNVKFK